MNCKPGPWRRISVMAAMTLGFVGSPVPAADGAASNTWRDPATAPAEVLDIDRVLGSLLLDAVNSRDRAVVVGDRGHILVSESRSDWRQVPVPTRSMLTAVTAVDNRMWAVGHDHVIVYSSDGGLTWTLQYKDPANEWPLLDVLFLDGERGFAIGAYGQFMSTRDGGANWQSGLISERSVGAALAAEPKEAADDEAADDEDSWLVSTDVGEDETDPHLNAMVRTSLGLLIVGEAGKAYRSLDDGETWEMVRLPYEGSMFGAVAMADGSVVAYGLRGNVFLTRDLGRSWAPVDTGIDATLLGGAALEGGGAVLVGASGAVVLLDANGQNPRHYTYDGGGVMGAVLPLGGSNFLVVGENGLSTFAPN